MKTTSYREKGYTYQWDFEEDEGREEIHRWSKRRQQRFHGINRTYHGFLVYTFSLNTLKNFFQNFNFMVLIQMMLAALSIYIFQRFDIYFDMNVTLYVSPIVFPLSFSINADFQRREKVLEDLANFKTGCMFWFFATREWKVIANLDEKWMNSNHTKLKTILFYLREYLLTERIDRRKVIVNALYEDLSDCSEVIEQVRAKQLAASSSISGNMVTYLQAMTLSFERLRVVREYRSPRSIRSFNKVLILLLPIIIAPYFVNQSRDSAGKVVRSWTPYYISILVSFVFSALQGVQDKLDDPFDGMSEDDINLEQIDEWTFNSLQATVNRSFKVGRFQVDNVECHETLVKPQSLNILLTPTAPSKLNNFEFGQVNKSKLTHSYSHESTSSPRDYGLCPLAGVLENISGKTRIGRCGVAIPPYKKSLSLTADRLDSQSKTKQDNSPFELQALYRNSIEVETAIKKPRHGAIPFNDEPKVSIVEDDSCLENGFEDSLLLPKDQDSPNHKKMVQIPSLTSRFSLIPPKNPEFFPENKISNENIIASETETLDSYENTVDVIENIKDGAEFTEAEPLILSINASSLEKALEQKETLSEKKKPEIELKDREFYTIDVGI